MAAKDIDFEIPLPSSCTQDLEPSIKLYYLLHTIGTSANPLSHHRGLGVGLVQPKNNSGISGSRTCEFKKFRVCAIRADEESGCTV